MSTEILLVLAVALVLDRIVGDPDWLWRRLPHPVAMFGGAIGWLDGTFNRKRFSGNALRITGALGIVVLMLLSIAVGFVIHRLFGLLVETLVVAVCLAQKSLGDHVVRVATALRNGGLREGRKAVSMIVGRDPQTLDEPAVCRAAIESLAENFSDGVVAPALWYAILGLPGLLAYKMLNTADSMIGHKTPKHLHFGWASARLDDLANLPAARLSVFLIAAGAWLRIDRSAARKALDVSLRDHALHRSPNSGWPEAAMAGALDMQLAGPRLYSGVLVSEPMINEDGRSLATVSDIEKAIGVYYAACAALTVVVVVLVAVRALL